jgi:hypothetical protein
VIDERSGNDIIVSGDVNDRNAGRVGQDIIVCGDGEIQSRIIMKQKVTFATPDCENV